MDDYGNDQDAVAEPINWGEHINTKTTDVNKVKRSIEDYHCIFPDATRCLLFLVVIDTENLIW